ncbi:MAG: pyridoxamine 5'-phosphate oxidase family protein [Rhodanobacter sp.]|jgi:predicted pyridoxine 5'-phosphate oxidase superfamily flavin-nucleotide-binding protein|nr:pyridoxamine 5'-phosphate oxidase family protein [Rhodanobacter sp.]
MMDDTVLQYIRQSVLCWLATVDGEGVPNVSPKELFCAHDDCTLVIANIASPQSRSNILIQSMVCVSFVDVFVQKGFKLKGRARVLQASDAQFPELARPLKEMTGERFPFSCVFAIDVRSVEPIVAPSYRLYPDTCEASQIQSAMRTYGVQPLAAYHGS